MITTEQKNINILNRFETKEVKSKFKKFTINFKDGKGAIVLSPDDDDIYAMEKIAKEKFGDRYESITEG